MADFKKALPFILKWEGGFVNDPDDPGGATNKGITLKTYQYTFGKDRTVEDLKNITDDEVETVYKGEYWDKVKGDDIDSQQIAGFLFDFSVNCGVRTAVRHLQQILSLEADGVFGKMTLEAVNGYPDKKRLFEHLKKDRLEYYRSLCEKNGVLNKFLKGWENRVNSWKW